MKHRNAWLLVSSAALMTVGFWGCGDDTTGSGGIGGGATTNSTVSTSATKATGVTVTSTTSGQMVEFVGQACTGDGECGPMGRCILPTDDDPFLGGGPADGYCTIDCTDDSQCPNNGFCGDGSCFLGCEIGPELMFIDDELSEDKCHAREDVRCVAVTDDLTACIPTCGVDAQCAGRSCDPRIAVCVDTPSTGLPDGAICDAEADPPECEGVCVNFTSGETICSNRCVLGGVLDGNDCGGLTEGVCVYRPSSFGAGDQGFCAPACSVQTDCANPTWWCFSNNFARNGFCFGATECPNGQADCDPMSGDQCTQTQHGPFCLDPLIPLGEGGGGVGGGGVGGGGTGGGGVGGGGGAGGN